MIHALGITRKTRNSVDAKQLTNISADSLNNFFLRNNLISQETLNLSLPNTGNRNVFRFVDATGDDIVRAVYSIKSNASGEDGITLRFIKLILPHIVNPLLNLINYSFQTGTYPDALKNITVDPLPKNNNPSSESDFRPICRINIISKIISVLVNKQLTKYVEQNNILSPLQSGFRAHHSCTTALLDLSQIVYESITKNRCIIIVFIDFKNAFPSVNHDLLIQVLQSIGLDTNALSWFKSFLQNWQQSVLWNDQLSVKATINTGVFQGEGSSQLLFSLFINQLISYVKNCSLRQFADDTCLLIESKIDKAEIEASVQKINDDMVNVLNFCQQYQLSVNPKKSEAIIISSRDNIKKIAYESISPIIYNNEIIEYSDTVRYLGYHMDREFSSTPQINIISKRIYCSLSQLYPLKYSLPTNIKLNMLKTLILPIFDYMDIIYHEFGTHGGGINATKLQRMFNSGIRFVYGLSYNDHITPYIKKSQLLPLEKRRELHILSMVYRIMNGMAPAYLNSLIDLNANNTRSKNKLIVKKPRNNCHAKSFAISAPLLWNKLNEDIRCKNNVHSFMSVVKNKYIVEYLK